MWRSKPAATVRAYVVSGFSRTLHVSAPERRPVGVAPPGGPLRLAQSAAVIEPTLIVFVLASSMPVTRTLRAANFSGVF